MILSKHILNIYHVIVITIPNTDCIYIVLCDLAWTSSRNANRVRRHFNISVNIQN